MIRSSSRVRRKPQKVNECVLSPKNSTKNPAPAKIKATKNRKDPIEYDIKVIYACRCEVMHWAFCHFVGYDEDQWRPYSALSCSAMGEAAIGPGSCTPEHCKRRNLVKCSDPPVGVASPHDPVLPITPAMQFLNNNFGSPHFKQKKSKPPVPLFPSSPLPPHPPNHYTPPYPPPPPSPPPSPFQSSPAFADPDEVISANPALSMAIADSMWQPPPPRELYEHVPDMEEFFETLADSINLSLSHSFGVGFWKSKGAPIWRIIREDVITSLEVALTHQTDLSIFQACSDLLLAPTKLLRCLGFVPPVPANKPIRNPIDVAVKLASEAILRGDSGKALRLLTGNGAAPQTHEQLQRTSDLFPEPRKFVDFIPTEDVLTVDGLGISKMFRQLVSSLAPATPDVFGWDPTLFRDIEGARFILVVTRFLRAYVGWSHAPPICAQLFACSKLISIYKLPEAERELLPDDQKTGTRPIGGQCLFGKMIDRESVATDEANLFKASVLPVQQAFHSRGVISIPLAALGALKSGHAVAKGDVSNAYQEICRLAALDNLQVVAPALANYFSRALLQSIPLFTRDVNGTIQVIWSTTGAPQGSVSGNIIYTAGVSKIFDILQREFPEFVLFAATDDLTQFFKPDTDDPDAWQAQYKRLAHFLQRYEDLAWDMCSLRQNLAKSAIILPLNAPFPSSEVLDLFPSTFKFHHVSNVVPEGVLFPNRTDGMVICGAPVGSDFYIQHFVRWKTSAAIKKILAIRQFGKSDVIPTPKHAAFKLLASSGTKLLSYLAAAVPPQYTVKYLKKFDNVVREAFLGLLYDQDRVVITERVRRSYQRATLSIGKGGLGLLKSSVSAAALWWTNLRAIQSNPTFYPFVKGLSAFVPDALVFISENVGGLDSVAWTNLAPHFLPDVDDEVPEVPPKGLLKEILIACGNFQHLLVKDDFAPDKVVQDGSLTKSDVISYNARTNLNLVFNNKRIKNLSNEQFVKLTTIFLGLPPSQDRGNAKIIPGLDYPVESCMTVHGRNITPFLDANGDHHAGACPSAAASVSQRHSALSRVISMFALEAGAYPTREPPTYKIFQGLLSAGQCSSLFPKTTPSAYKTQAKEIVDLLSQASVDEAKISELCSKLPHLDPANSASLRVDIAIDNPSNHKVYLVDGSFIHPSCAGYRDSEFKDVSKRLEAAAQASRMKSTEPMRWDPSLTIAAKAKIKVDKHAPVMQILKSLERNGRISQTHYFVPFIVSSLGELSREAFCFIEEIVAMYRHRVSMCEDIAFPLLPNQAVADFRYRFKIAIMRVAAVGLANIACRAGLPFGNRALYAVH